jgi:hypothetical protein
MIHFVWLGPAPLPAAIFGSWRRHHPDWEIVVWDESRLKGLKLHLREFYSLLRTKRYNQRSDVLRLEILYRYGGVYVDSDILCINRIPDLEADFFSVVEKKGLVSNAFMGAVKGYPLLLDMLRQMEHTWVPDLPVWKTTGPQFVTDYLLRRDIIRPCAEHRRTYDFTSLRPGLVILPYYVVNFMKDSVGQSTSRTMDLAACKPAKDVFHHHDTRWGDMVGLHLWFGGKVAKYTHQVPAELIRENLVRYIEFVSLAKSKNK